MDRGYLQHSLASHRAGRSRAGMPGDSGRSIGKRHRTASTGSRRGRSTSTATCSRRRMIRSWRAGEPTGRATGTSPVAYRFRESVQPRRERGIFKDIRSFRETEELRQDTRGRAHDHEAGIKETQNVVEGSLGTWLGLREVSRASPAELCPGTLFECLRPDAP